MTYHYDTYGIIRTELRNYLKQLREKAQREDLKQVAMFKKVIFTEARKGYFQNQYVNRLVLFLRGTGCSLVRETGGCTFCGFYNATNFGVKVPDVDYIAQIMDVLADAQSQFHQYPIICLYNDGSMLREEEISFTTTLQIIQILSERENVKKIVLESRVEDITEEKLRQLRAATDKELELAVGFESANPLVRDLCVNKNFNNSFFEANCRIAKEYEMNLIPLMIVKPPFLTEKEALQDYIHSLIYLEQFKLKRIDMELPTVEANTLVHELWEQGYYRPVWLWSVITILRIKEQLGLKTPIYISPMVYSVDATVKAANCPNCDSRIAELFEEYNRSGNSAIFDSLDCLCKEEWQWVLQNENDGEELPQRVVNTLHRLEQDCRIKNIS